MLKIRRDTLTLFGLSIRRLTFNLPRSHSRLLVLADRSVRVAQRQDARRPTKFTEKILCLRRLTRGGPVNLVDCSLPYFENDACLMVHCVYDRFARLEVAPWNVFRNPSADRRRDQLLK